jgi:hypothetical protein
MLGFLRREEGDFARGLRHLQRGHELSWQQPHPDIPSAQWAAEALRLVRLQAQLPAVLAGTRRPANPAETLEYAHVCRLTSRPSAAARLYAESFAGDARLADDLSEQPRYHAACCAALAAAGQAEDSTLTPTERLRWRRQALTWLRGELAVRGRQTRQGSDGAKAAAEALSSWRADDDLAGLRTVEALVALSPEERDTCLRLWADVAALLSAAESKK